MALEGSQVDRSELQKLTFRDLVYKYLRFFPLYIIFIILAFLGAWLYLRYAQERYSAAGSIIINSGGSNDKVEELMLGNTKDRNLQNEIEVLHSKPLLTRVAKKLNLQFGYTAVGNVKDVNAYKRTPFQIQPIQIVDSNLSFSLPIEIVNANQFKLNNEEIKYTFGQNFKTPQGVFKLVKQGEPTPGNKYVVSYTTPEAVAASIMPAIDIQPKIPGTGILTIVYESTNPFLAADVVNTVMTEYNMMSVEQNAQSLMSKIDFADKRLSDLQTDIDSLQQKIVRYQKSNDLISAEAQIQEHLSKASQQTDVMQNQQIALASLSQIEGYLRNKGNQFSSIVVPSSLGISDPTLNSMISRYNETQLQRKTLIDANITEDNPKIAIINQSIEGLRESILENIRILKSSYGQMLGMASSTKSRNRSIASDLPARASEQKDLERQLESKQRLYDILNENREQGALSVSGVLPGGKIVEKAEPNPNPVKPQKNTIRAIALLMGLLIPTAFLFFKEVLNDRVNTRTDIQKNTDAPILGEIGHSYAESSLIVSKTNRTLIAEQFRIIRSNLQYIVGKRDKAVILVTSSFSGEGKSFISTNIGAVLALTDKKTIVLEFDLRKPRVLAGLNMNKRPGISNFMIGNVTLDELIVPIEGEENLYVLPCGPIPPNPAELLLTEKIAELFEQLKSKFDYVVIDTAPVGMVSDALTLAKYADCTLYVTRQGRTFKKQVGLIDEMYRLKKLPHLSIILNDVQMPTGGGYYGNYGYGYYGYGANGNNGYYDDEKPNKNIREKLTKVLKPSNWGRSKK